MPINYRYLTKGALLMCLLLFFLLNKKGITKNLYVVLSLVFIFFAEMFLINIDYAGKLLVFFGMLCIVLSKICLCLKMANKRDFKFSELIPLAIIYGFILIIIFGLILNNLKEFFIPVLLYYIFSLITGLFVYLRKGVFSTRSFFTVLFGAVLYFIGENISAISLFTNKLSRDFYLLNYVGVIWGMYFVVIGIFFEKDSINKNLETEEYLM